MVPVEKKTSHRVHLKPKQSSSTGKREKIIKEKQGDICTLKPGDYMETEMGYEMMEGKDACNEYEKTENNL